MANDEHVAMLQQGVAAWNEWRHEKRIDRPDLSKADLRAVNLRGWDVNPLLNTAGCQVNLSSANLCGADLRGADLGWADLHGAELNGADVSGTDLRGANLREADLSLMFVGAAPPSRTNLRSANLSGARLGHAKLHGAILSGADLSGANLIWANLQDADLDEADLCRADLSSANLLRTNFSRATLNEADLYRATLVDTDFTGADLTGCHIHGVSAWGLKLEGAKQRNQVITPLGDPEITADNIEVAQFIYLMLHNEKVRNVIDTITSKAVLILGRFTDERKAVLNALREELRKRDYLPILFDFEKPRSRDTDETVTLLARMARFIIADVSDAKSVLQELRGIVPDLPSVPVQTIILAAQEEPGMFDFYRHRPSFLPVHGYADQEQLLADLGDKVIRPAELKVLELRG
ncbi:uncharacterized protein YjbI with pentapeptide repeats [Bradyrhizobium sp. AZCC 2262]|uniref:pentapeptide repeat-containing protein n=1 Tax=Bradyrhizobium sp. AZCC 2262 TaxID=3117022 RepID=UPI002FEF1037